MLGNGCSLGVIGELTPVVTAAARNTPRPSPRDLLRQRVWRREQRAGRDLAASVAVLPLPCGDPGGCVLDGDRPGHDQRLQRGDRDLRSATRGAVLE